MSEENISMSVEEKNMTTHGDTNVNTNETASETTNTANPTNQVRLVDAVIDSQNMALNVMVGFIGVAQKRGVFSLDESAKLYECIKMFQGGPNGDNQATN